MIVGENFERIDKQLAGVDAAAHTDSMARLYPSGLQGPSPAAWSGIRVTEQQWLQKHKRSMVPPMDPIAQSLVRIPEVKLPVFHNSEWFKGLTNVAGSVDSFYKQVNTMVETVSYTMAAPMARLAQMGEGIMRPIQGWQQLVGNIPSAWNFNGFWKGLQPTLQQIQILLDDADAGRKVLRASEFGFADHFWGIFYVRGFAHIPERVRPAVVTTRLVALTTSEWFVEDLQDAVASSRLMRKRRGVLESICEAHAAKNYNVAVPAALAQIEGTLVDLMFLKDLVKKENGKFYLVDKNGDFKLRNDNKTRLGPVTLGPAITNAKLDEEANLAAASEFVANTLVQRRNAVMHGRDLSYGKAKFSVQALLLLAVLSEAVLKLELGDVN